MKAFIIVNTLGLVLGAAIGLSAKEPHRFPPRILFPSELQKVRNTFSIESVREARQSGRSPFEPAPLRPVPGSPPEINLAPEDAGEFYRNPVKLLGIEPIDDDETDEPVLVPIPEPARKMRRLTDEEWRHSAQKRPAFRSEPAKR